MPCSHATSPTGSGSSSSSRTRPVTTASPDCRTGWRHSSTSTSSPAGPSCTRPPSPCSSSTSTGSSRSTTAAATRAATISSTRSGCGSPAPCVRRSSSPGSAVTSSSSCARVSTSRLRRRSGSGSSGRSRSRTSRATTCSPSRRASAWPSLVATNTSTGSNWCVRPTSRCTTRRSGDAPAWSCSTRPCRRRSRRRPRSNSHCARRSATASSCCTTNRCSTSRAARRGASRRSCAGTDRATACSDRIGSSPSPSGARWSSTSAAGCCTKGCRTLARWQADPARRHLRIAVNVSGRHLVEGNLLADIDEVLTVTGADPAGSRSNSPRPICWPTSNGPTSC